MNQVIKAIFEALLYAGIILLFIYMGAHLLINAVKRQVEKARKRAQIEAGAPVIININGRDLYGVCRGLSSDNRVKVKAGPQGLIYYVPFNEVVINL